MHKLLRRHEFLKVLHVPACLVSLC
jgi:hypothetical protein